MLITVCSHKGVGFYAQAIRRKYKYDPTKTLVLRSKFCQQMRVRFNNLKVAMRKSIVDLDGFGLKANKIEPRRFDFARDSDKVAGFMEWLEQAELDGILEVLRGTPMSSAAEQSWMNVYIDTAYNKGIRDAGMAMRAAGGNVSDRWMDAAFNQPINADRVGLIYTRAYNDLEGITDAMDQQISRALANGLANGDGMMDIADELTSMVDDIGEVRAEMLARTEVIAAHAEGALNSYEEAGIEGVSILAEWATAQDDAVCPLCDEREGEEISIEEARGQIPLHPNCRCAWLPVVSDGSEINLE